MSRNTAEQRETMNRLIAIARSKRVSIHVDEANFRLVDATTGEQLAEIDRSSYDTGLAQLADELAAIDAIRPAKSSAADMLAAVKAHAMKHYDEDGWSIVIEMWDDATTLSVIVEAGATTIDQALDAVRNDPQFDRIGELLANAVNREW